MGDVSGKDEGCGREGWEMWQRRMGNVVEKDGGCSREG
jgi:hypothetical protein